MSKDNFLEVKEACDEVGRPLTTVRQWLRDGRVKSWKHEGRWYVDVDDLRNFSLHSEVRVQAKTTYKGISTKEELESQSCPRCSSSVWERSGYTDVSNGEVNIVLLCKNDVCGRRWSIRVDKNSELLNKRRAYRRGVRHYGSSRMGMHLDDDDQRVQDDRKRFVGEFIDEGYDLEKILQIFGEKVHDDVRIHYRYFMDKKSVTA
ncbi:hypothetical protein CMK19_00700 [Candidatus Poribacteria bacterium]|nr:hypothetical protein [Candidatus Poribacteria bacterium]|tara:strand:- start:1388 stop:1999 length:612 start_codon:yes stop_codon:yes gene_type:complete